MGAAAGDPLALDQLISDYPIDISTVRLRCCRMLLWNVHPLELVLHSMHRLRRIGSSRKASRSHVLGESGIRRI